MFNRQVVSHKSRVRPVTAQRHFAVTPDRHHRKTARPRQVKRHIKGERFRLKGFITQRNMNTGKCAIHAGSRFYAERLTVDFCDLHRTNAPGITHANHQEWLPQRHGFALQLRHFLRRKLRFYFEIGVPDLPVIDTDASGLHALISLNEQRFRQDKVQVAFFVFDLFLILKFVKNLGDRNGNQRSYQLLRPAGALAKRVFNIVTVALTLRNQVTDHKERD